MMFYAQININSWSHAVGKMTVGQESEKKQNLNLCIITKHLIYLQKYLDGI